MKKYLKILGKLCVIVGIFVLIVTFGFIVGGAEPTTADWLIPLYVIVSGIVGGIFILAFAEVLERLEAIQKNTGS